VQPEAIFTSPLTRARQTGEILQEVFGVRAQAEPGLASGCSLGVVQEMAGRHPGGRMVLVGHEPDLSRMVGQLIGGGRVRMAKSGAARVDVERVEPGAGALVWVVGPEVVRGEEKLCQKGRQGG
jgi:phosphohistidine phosphatase